MTIPLQMKSARMQYSIFICISLFVFDLIVAKNGIKRKRLAFDLVRIEKSLLENYQQKSTIPRRRSMPTKPQQGGFFLVSGQQRGILGEHSDLFGVIEEATDKSCKSKCNEQLRMGLDMVKAHSAFGSIGVPSVEDELDLQLFCRLDSEHDQCLQNCGYDIQFNMRDYVCKDHFLELSKYLECYSGLAKLLKRVCGVKRCGEYKELELSGPGIAQRCRSLTCDINCIQPILNEHCPQLKKEPGNFLLQYTRIQVSAWLREINATGTSTPKACIPLFTNPFPETEALD